MLVGPVIERFVAMWCTDCAFEKRGPRDLPSKSRVRAALRALWASADDTSHSQAAHHARRMRMHSCNCSSSPPFRAHGVVMFQVQATSTLS